MALRSLNVPAFYAALSNKRDAEEKSWREVAREVGVCSSIFTRMSKGHRPDVDTAVTLAAWLGISLERFADGPDGPPALEENTLEVIAEFLRADRSLKPKTAHGIESIVRAAYDQLAEPEDDDG